MRQATILSLILIICTLLGPGNTQADPRDYAVEVSAIAQESYPRLVFVWPADPSAAQYYVFKKEISDTLWGAPIAVIDGDQTQFVDNDIAIGEAFEYSFRKTLSYHSESVSVPAGTQLTFVISDSWNDGMCCHHGIGSYSVSAGETVFASGGQFGTSETTSFNTGSASQLDIDLVLDVYGMETSWVLKHGTTGATLAQGGPYDAPHFGHICAGIRYTPPEDRGTVLLLLDSSVLMNLPEEIKRLELDLIADGYRVQRISGLGGYSVTYVKERILEAVADDPSITTLFLLGALPVPYSGNIGGSHADHRGAWPADVYYGELDGEWTDYLVNNTSASRPENHNVPGDGKFDQTFLLSDMDLQVGRVDLSRLPAFSENQYELLRRYLDKDHAFRRGELTVVERGLIDDNVGDALGLAFAATGWRNFATMFGADQVFAMNYLPTLETSSYLWAYGCGGSSYTYCGGVAGTQDFATKTINAVFSPLYGSYFGDWHYPDCVLRSPLAAEGQPLVCFWAGCPTWSLHHMSLGFPIGYSTVVTQNNTHLYTPSDGSRQIRIALMGDPTLRMFIVKPPSALTLSEAEEGAIDLSWTSSSDATEGYHVYRAPELYGEFIRLTTTPIAATNFRDPAPLPEDNIYMVRALKLQQSASGTFLNLSAGIIDSITANTDVPPEMPPAHGYLAPCFPNPFNPETTIRYHLENEGDVLLRIIASDGRVVRQLVAARRTAGWHEQVWDGRDDAGRLAASGNYLCRLKLGSFTATTRMTLLK
ncbi:MAG: hypothetical protein GY835_18980 [bacterium]|nr:hypothetical protein [bacterium]